MTGPGADEEWEQAPYIEFRCCKCGTFFCSNVKDDYGNAWIEAVQAGWTQNKSHHPLCVGCTKAEKSQRLGMR